MIWPVVLEAPALNSRAARQNQKGVPNSTAIRGSSHPPLSHSISQGSQASAPASQSTESTHM